jgi:DNA-binding Lrp family transcriptional regulator
MVEAIRKTPQIVTCERVSGDDCFVARAHVRGGPGCLNRVSASISGASAGVRPPCGLAAR